MDENMIVEMLSRSILEAIEAMEHSGLWEPMKTVPEPRFYWTDSTEPVTIAGMSLDDGLLKRVEDELRERLFAQEHPTVLH